MEGEGSKSKRGAGGASCATRDRQPGFLTPMFRRALLARLRSLRTMGRARFSPWGLLATPPSGLARESGFSGGIHQRRDRRAWGKHQVLEDWG